MVKPLYKVHYFDFGNFRLDVINRELLKNGVHVPLTQKSFELLHFLIQHRGRGMRKTEILNRIWTESYVEEANLAQHIYMIRKVLKDSGNNENYIETIPKYGYRFNGEVFEHVGEEKSESATSRITNLKRPEASGADDLNVHTFDHANDGSNDPPLAAVPDRALGFAFGYTKPTILISIFVVLLAFVGYYFYVNYDDRLNVSDIKSVAILPFNQIGDSKDEKLGLGMADTLISRLSNQKQISISPTSTIIKFIEKGTDNPIEIGEKLGVDAILTGTIQRDNDTVRVNIQLISVRKRVPLWSDKFDAKFSNIFALQDAISEHVAAKLSLQLSESRTLTVNNRYTVDIEAYQAYTMGLFYWGKRLKTNLAKAIDNFERAIAKDPKFATAYALLADSYSLVAYSRMDLMSEQEAISKAKEMANRALALDPNSSEAVTALATVAQIEKKPEESIALYRKAIQLTPNNATAHQRLAWMLSTTEGLESALVQMHLAQKADPQSRVVNSNLTRLLRLNRQPDEALNFCKRAIEIDPSVASTKLILAELYEQKGMFDDAVKELNNLIKTDPDDATYPLILSRIKAKKNKKISAQKILDKILKGKDEKNLSYEAATAYLYLGKKDKALGILKNSVEDSRIFYLHIKYDHNLDPIRNTPDFDKILADSKNRFHLANG